MFLIEKHGMKFLQNTQSTRNFSQHKRNLQSVRNFSQHKRNSQCSFVCTKTIAREAWKMFHKTKEFSATFCWHIFRYKKIVFVFVFTVSFEKCVDVGFPSETFDSFYVERRCKHIHASKIFCWLFRFKKQTGQMWNDISFVFLVKKST